MSEYNWREDWEEQDSDGHDIAWVIKLPDECLLICHKHTPKRYWAAESNGRSMNYSSTGHLIPKRKLRPWTAKEWGSRIGDMFIYDADNKVTLSIVKTYAIYPRYIIGNSIFEVLLEDTTQLKQLDGSPCGEYE